MCGIFAYIKNHDENELEMSNLELENIIEHAMRTRHRGPDNTVILPLKKNNLFVFHRLAIMDETMRGTQPMMHPCDENIILMCNGEIYNHKELEKRFGYSTTSNSDCEVILHLYKEHGMSKTIRMLDGAFAFILYDGNTDEVFAGRDPFGIRSLYMGYTEDSSVVFASELKNVHSLCITSRQFTPGTWWCSNNPRKFNFYERMRFSYFTTLNEVTHSEEDANKCIVSLLTQAVRKRMMSDREIGCFLSGGLDSSLVAALVAKEYDDPKKLHTFSIGMPGSTDLKYAAMVAKFIGTTHHEVIVSKKEMLEAIPDVVRQIESYDTTTVRASTPMFLLSKWIKKNTNTTVIFSGEGSDELSGSYMYFHNCPGEKAFQRETNRLIQDLYHFDVLRCDKSVSGAGLEARVPFLDMDFVRYYMQIPPSYKLPRNGVEKFLLRNAFSKLNLLPNEVLWRTKEAFSDGVSSVEDSWSTTIQNFVNTKISEGAFTWQCAYYEDHCNPPSLKETLYYRRIFDMEYPGCANILPYYWLPKWTGNVEDPSARVLSVYKNTDSSKH